jgi:hypothetical protein
MKVRGVAPTGVRGVRGALLVALVLLGLLSLCCVQAYAEPPSVRRVRSGEAPFIQIEEFVPGAAHVNADFSAFLVDEANAKLTTVSLQYVDASGYDPKAVDPYAAGVTAVVATTNAGQPELHAYLALEEGRVYHYRVLAYNSEGSFETTDQTVNTYPASRGVLPDGRAYEQVSPVDKNHVDALGRGEAMTMQASPSSSAPAFAFFSFEPFPVAVGTAGLTTDYLSTRSTPPEAWSTQGVQAPIEPLEEGGNEVSGFTEDLSRTIITTEAPSHVFNAYVRDNANGSYQLLAPSVGSSPVFFVDATRDDSHILFETERQLLSAAAAGVMNLYEWDETKPEGERLSLAGILPDAECAALSKPSGCAPANGSGAGQSAGSGSRQDYLQNTISEDGSKIFFTAHPSGRIYVRELLAEPSPVTVPVSPDAATFLAATPSGRYAFYTEGAELYRFDTASETRQALTSGAEGVAGSLGVSDDGTYAYFVANGVLSANGNANGEEATKGAPNLYKWHEDLSANGSTFIARLVPKAAAEGDATDWAASNIVGSEEGKTARVNPSGTALLFMSQSPLTGYDNGTPLSSVCRGGSGRSIVPCAEFFLYNANEPLSSANPVCVSCNPTGAPASAPARLGVGDSEVGAVGPIWSSHLTRNLAASGGRVFFETAESLVSADTNGVSDVYEWEREGVGSCPAGGGRCLYLISTGTAHARSFFGDADAEGENVFFFTRQPLVGQDHDLNFDVYDARVGGGIAAQNPPPVESCEGEAKCKPPPSAAPASGAPASIILTGSGNLILPQSPVVTLKCAKGRRLSHGKCIIVRCFRGRKLSHGKCVKVKDKRKARARKTAGSVGRGVM